MVDGVLGIGAAGPRLLNGEAGEESDFGDEFLGVAKLTSMILPSTMLLWSLSLARSVSWVRAIVIYIPVTCEKCIDL